MLIRSRTTRPNRTISPINGILVTVVCVPLAITTASAGAVNYLLQAAAFPVIYFGLWRSRKTASDMSPILRFSCFGTTLDHGPHFGCHGTCLGSHNSIAVFLHGNVNALFVDA